MLAGALLLVPFSQTGRLERALVDLGHAPLFFLLAWCLGQWLLPSVSRWRALTLVWVLVAGFGFVSEFLQAWVGRHPSWRDLSANLLGTTAGVLWLKTQKSQITPSGRRGLRISAGILLALGLVPAALIIVDVILERFQRPMLASFESPLELSRWTFQDCQVRRVRKHATQGDWSLEVDLGTGQYPGLARNEVPPDWRTYRELALDVTLETPGSLLLIVKITDESHNWKTEDRFHYAVHLRRGPNRIRIPLRDVEHGPKDRLMDLSRIKMLQLFTIRPPASSRIFLDNIRLIPAHPEVEARAPEESDASAVGE